MQFKSFTGAAVLLALAPVSMAMGVATVINNCGFPVYFASVDSAKGAPMQLLQGSYSQTFSKPGVGVSIKVSPTNSLMVPHSQFEFTLMGNGKVAYDLSNIDGYPFSKGGISIVPSMQGDAANPSCIPVNCPAGQAYCSAAYNLPDDTRTLVCNENANIVMTLCPAGPKKREEPVVAIEEGHIIYRVHARHMPKKIAT